MSTRQFKRARAKMEFKKMKAQKLVPSNTPFNRFFDFFVKNESQFMRVQKLTNQLSQRTAKVTADDVNSYVESMLASDLDESYFDFVDSESETTDTQTVELISQFEALEEEVNAQNQ